MSDLINKHQLSEDIVKAIDKNLKGEARRMYIDSHSISKDLIVDFIEALAAKLDKRFSN